MLIHHPSSSGLKHKDPKNVTNRHESWKVMEDFVDKGLIKSIGVSNFKVKHLQELLPIARIKPVVNQIELHPLYVEQETLDFCQQH